MGFKKIGCFDYNLAIIIFYPALLGVELACALSNENPIDEGMRSAEGTQSPSLAEVASGNLYNGTIIDGCRNQPYLS